MKSPVYSLLLAVLFAVSAGSAGDMKSLKAGDKAPAFALKNYDGKDVSLETVLKENQVAVVMFMATQCPVSNAYNGRMEALYEAYSGKKVGVVGINANKEETAADVATHAKEHKFGFPVAKDPNNVIADAYGAMVTPEVFVIGKDMTIFYHGRIDDSKKEGDVKKKDLAEALDAVLAGKKAAADQPKAFGCSIKRVGDAAP
jgi:peroxiredoxin